MRIQRILKPWFKIFIFTLSLSAASVVLGFTYKLFVPNQKPVPTVLPAATVSPQATSTPPATGEPTVVNNQQSPVPSTQPPVQTIKKVSVYVPSNGATYYCPEGNVAAVNQLIIAVTKQEQFEQSTYNTCVQIDEENIKFERSQCLATCKTQLDSNRAACDYAYSEDLNTRSVCNQQATDEYSVCTGKCGDEYKLQTDCKLDFSVSISMVKQIEELCR